MSIGAGITYGLLFISLYFEVFLLLAFIKRRFSPAPVSIPIPTELPRIAIAVPCFNESRTVESTIRSLLALDYPADKLEIIAVDDGSTDTTLSVLEQFEGDSRVRIFSKENGGKHTAMNLALANTSAELIGCLDADSVVAPDALKHIVPVFQNERVSAVTPCILVKEPQTVLQHMQNVEYRLSIFNRFILAAIGSVFITPGPFSFFRASVVRELGGWRYAHSTEDMEMALRMQREGHLIANAPSAVVHTSTPRTLPALFRQRVRWTYGWLRNAVDYRHMIGNGSYGNLGIIVLPSALISIAAGIYFFLRIAVNAVISLREEILRVQYSGTYPHASFDLFYVNTSMMLFLVFVSVGLILTLISAGSFIGTGSRRPPLSTPLFLLFYSFLVPLWLGTAVVRAVFKTGVNWR
jgi:cellulose synthase/poly-beta-1,6-N-acetylglucosamine synthase-like glycosyltransferase